MKPTIGRIVHYWWLDQGKRSARAVEPTETPRLRCSPGIIVDVREYVVQDTGLRDFIATAVDVEMFGLIPPAVGEFGRTIVGAKFSKEPKADHWSWPPREEA